MRNISISSTVLESLVSMANEHVRDLDAGLKDGTRAACNNKDIEKKRNNLLLGDATLRSALARPTADFELRCNPESGNLLFSYGVNEDHMAGDTHGYQFIGIGRDDQGNEVHVFLMKPLPINVT